MNEFKSHYPKRRFKEFENSPAWEQRKLQKNAKFLKGKGLSWKDIVEDGKQECILYGNLYTDYGMIAEDIKYRTNSYINNPVYSEFGDVLIPSSDTTPTGLARATSIEKSGVLLGGDINIIRVNENINGSCLSLAINSNKNKLIRLIEGTTVRHIYNSSLKEIAIPMPISLIEQEQIGSFFKELDNLITLHQRKLDKTIHIKESYLNNLFPKSNEKPPRLRFKDFKCDWEQRKLKDLAKFTKGKGYSKNDILDKGTPIILYGRLYTDYETFIESVDTFVNPKGNDVISKGNELIVPSSGETSEDIARASVVAKDGIILGSDLNIIKLNNILDPIFSALSLTYGKNQKELMRLAQGSSIIHLYNSDLKTANFSYPSKQEQVQIGLFFKELDHLITLHQRKVEKLNNIKKAYLNELFVQTGE